MAGDRLSRVLIIDDELSICRNCIKILSKLNLEVEYALSGFNGLHLMEKKPFDLVVTDLKMHALGGMEVLRRIKKAYPETMVIVMTGYASISSSVEVMKLGALDYLPKPFTPEEFRATVIQALEQKALLEKNRECMAFNRAPNTPSHQLIGTSPKIKQVIRMIGKVAPTDSTVLIYGESGTGKELVARAIYANSRQKDGPFFAVDCGTLSSSLLESELFGHTRGAFTGAHKDKEGIFKLAQGGTVFLDEISNISLEIQSKLLRFLETREFLPVGAVKTVKVNVRLIFATNQNLEELVAAGSFRADFYYRIYVYPIMIPPLRERTTDILPIAYYFLSRFNQTMDKGITGFSEDAVKWLTAYEWPGNIRQLRNVIERAVISCEGDLIILKDLPVLSAGEDKGPAAETVPATNEELKQWKKEVRKKAVDQMEREFVLNALVKSNWNVTRAAGQVGLQRTNFQGLMKKHGIRHSVGSQQD